MATQQDPFGAGSGFNYTAQPPTVNPPPPDSNTSTQTNVAPPNANSGSGFQLPDWVTNQLNNFSGALSNPALIPSLAAAYQQYQQAHQYTDMAEKYAGQLDPFGQQRAQYQQLLSDSYSNPGKVLADPAHQAEVKASLDNVARTGASQGFLGSGNMEQALYDYSQKDDAAWLQNYRNGLITPSGANIGPQAAAGMLQTGLLGRMGAENNAIGNLMVPFANQNANNRANGTTTNGQNTTNVPKIPATAHNAQAAIQAMTAAGFPAQTAAQIFQALISNPGSISPSTIATLDSIGIQTPGMDGGMDTPAPGGTYGSNYGAGIDPSYNMDPNQGVDLTTTSILNSDPSGATGGGNFTGGYGNSFGPQDPFGSGDGGASTFPYDDSSSVTNWDDWMPGGGFGYEYDFGG